MIINPYYPHNFHFFRAQVAAGFNANFYMGLENAPPEAWEWFYTSLMAVVLFFGGIVLSFLKNFKQDSKTLGLLIFTIFLLVLQWKSNRFIEYWPVFGALTGLLLVGPYLEKVVLNIKVNWHKAETGLMIILILIFLHEGLYHGIWEFWNLFQRIGTTQDIQEYREVSNYLKTHSQDGDIVFNRWDYWPYLFYFNQKNYYVVGFSPSLLEFYNKDLFNIYIDLSFNRNSQIDPKVIKDYFKSKWVVVNPDQEALKEKLQNNPQLFRKVSGKRIAVFKVL